MGWQPSYQTEGRIYAKYILKEKPNARIAILYQNDDYGKDYVCRRPSFQSGFHRPGRDRLVGQTQRRHEVFGFLSPASQLMREVQDGMSIRATSREPPP